jgi:hypothetical protein
MDDIDKLKIQIAKLEGFTTGLATALHNCARQIDTLERYVYESGINRHEDGLEDEQAET